MNLILTTVLIYASCEKKFKHNDEYVNLLHYNNIKPHNKDYGIPVSNIYVWQSNKIASYN